MLKNLEFAQEHYPIKTHHGRMRRNSGMIPSRHRVALERDERPPPDMGVISTIGKMLQAKR